MGFWDSFEVYNRKKHAKDVSMLGTNHSNLGQGQGKTGYMYSHEYYGPAKKKAMEESGIISEAGTADMRKSSVSSESSGESSTKLMMGEDQPHMVDISKLTQNEFKRLYEGMRKGEPDNRVNF
ncbi:hypothetical protein HG536_0A03740 [Torulaspora globosa]|uniref:Stationary phase protein 4 n=1 Tax=Torulaspora globosa TaxID=48254 RepID=A0A7G3ZAM0_9SACH|nr:uncharacterized protein HG536_0A03740 [Torulaspora globosa]QLL30556.1 hypothetical protein HG536_0A03740 [Torulaspora globosa]